MINVRFIDIDNTKLVGRLLPFWARGRRISLMLTALLSPIKTLHEQFKAWALERYIFCHITAQAPSLEWYLKYKLKRRLANPDSHFEIISGLKDRTSCFGSDRWRGNLYWHGDARWNVNVATDYTDEELNLASKIIVRAPDICENPNYTRQDYACEIKSLLANFMISVKEIVILNQK